MELQVGLAVVPVFPALRCGMDSKLQPDSQNSAAPPAHSNPRSLTDVHGSYGGRSSYLGALRLNRKQPLPGAATARSVDYHPELYPFRRYESPQKDVVYVEN